MYDSITIMCFGIGSFGFLKGSQDSMDPETMDNFQTIYHTTEYSKAHLVYHQGLEEGCR